MRYHHQGSSLFVSILLLLSIFSFLFLGKEKLFFYQKQIQKYQLAELPERWQFALDYQQNNHQLCAMQKQNSVIKSYQHIQYSIHCEFRSLFLQPKPTKEKYIQVENINEWLDLDHYHQFFYPIKTLADLPNSDENDPKIAIALNAIDETLTKNFYGIIITDYLFDIKGKGKIFGTIYSTYNNQREERNLTYRRKVIDNLEEKFSRWEYLPYSRNILANEKTF